MTHERYEHRPLVEAWLKEPTLVPAADLERVSAAIAQTPQRRDRAFRLPYLRFQTMLDVTKAVTAAAVLGASGALLAMQLNGGMPDTAQAPMAVEATTTPDAAVTDVASDPELPTPAIVLPDGLESRVPSGNLDTPYGPARWVKLDRSGFAVPGPGKVLPLMDGVAVWRMDKPGSLYATSDGVNWREVQLPPEVSSSRSLSLDHIGGTTVLYSMDDDLIWTLADGAWQSVDTSALRDDRLRGWAGQPGSSWFELEGGQPALNVSQTYRLPYRKLNIKWKAETERLFPIGGMRYALCAEDGACNAKVAERVLRFKETDRGLVIRDDRTGKRLGLLEGAKADDLYQGLRAKSRLQYALVDDRLEPLGQGTVRERPDGAIPEPLPVGTEYWYSGTAHIAGVLQPHSDPPHHRVPTEWWAHIGGGWVDLAELGIPDLVPYRTRLQAETVGATTLIWFVEQEGHDLWVVQAPSEA